MDKPIPSAVSEKKAPLQSIARKTCQSVSFQVLCPATTHNRTKRETTNPVDTDNPAPSFPNLAIRWEETCCEKYRCHYTHNQHRRLIALKVDWLSLLSATIFIFDHTNTQQSMREKYRDINIFPPSSILFLYRNTNMTLGLHSPATSISKQPRSRHTQQRRRRPAAPRSRRATGGRRRGPGPS